MAFMRILRDRHMRNDTYNEGRFEDHSMDLLLSTLRCHDDDEFQCVANEDEGLSADDVVPFACKFTTVQNQEHILAVADEDGIVCIMDTSVGPTGGCIMRFRAHHNSIFDFCWVDREKKLVTASADKTAVLWDIPTKKDISVFKGHERSIKAIQFVPGNTDVFATGGRDGSIMIWDMRSQKQGNHNQADNIIRNTHFVQKRTSTPKTKITKRQTPTSSDGTYGVTSILFQNETTLISSGVSDGIIKVWDLRKNYSVYRNDPLPKYTIPYAGRSIKMNGYSNLLMDSSQTRLFASCTDDVIYQFNTASYEPEPVSAYFGHKNSSVFVKSVLCPRQKYILSGSSDNNAYMWNINRPGLPSYRISGHSAEVTSVAWCDDPYDHLKIVTCSDDSVFRIWRPNLINNCTSFFNETGDCQRVQPQIEDGHFWMNRVKPFEKYECLRVSGISSEIPNGKNKKKIHPVDLNTPKLVNASVSYAERPLRPKRAKLDVENCTITPPTSLLESPRKSNSSKRIMTGKCLFSDDVKSDQFDFEGQPQKRLKTSLHRSPDESPSSRSPFKILYGNGSPTKDLKRSNEEFSSPTSNLPNSINSSSAKESSSGNDDRHSKKLCEDQHWLSKLSSAKRKNCKVETRRSEMNKRMKMLQTTQPIKKYFSSIPN